MIAALGEFDGVPAAAATEVENSLRLLQTQDRLDEINLLAGFFLIPVRVDFQVIRPEPVFVPPGSFRAILHQRKFKNITAKSNTFLETVSAFPRIHNELNLRNFS